MTSQKTRIQTFEFYLHRAKGISKIISGPDFSSVTHFFSEMNFGLCHMRNLWIASENSDRQLPKNMKVKSDHRCKFSKLNNLKEVA